MVRCRYCSSETDQDSTDPDIIVCPRCHSSYFLRSREEPKLQEIYEARYRAAEERRKLYGLKHPQRPKPDPLRLKNPEVRIVNGIQVTQLRRDCVYAGSLKRPMSLLEKVAEAASAMLSNPKHSRTFYSHVDIPELKCSIILKAVYLGGLTVGYHELTDQLYIRPRGNCWQKFDLGDEHDAR